MKREVLLKEMRDSVGTKDPVEFFSKMVDVFTLLFDKIESLEGDLAQVKVQSALAIQWEPQVASDMLTKQIEVLRQDKETYHAELTALKKAYAEGLIVLKYETFCQFWIDTLGFHPFLGYDK
jgi:hypothetical protein